MGKRLDETKYCQGECKKLLRLDQFHKTIEKGFTNECKNCRNAELRRRNKDYNSVSNSRQKRSYRKPAEPERFRMACYNAIRDALKLYRNSIVSNSIWIDSRSEYLEKIFELCGWKISDLYKHLEVSLLANKWTWKDWEDGKIQIDHHFPQHLSKVDGFEHGNFKALNALSNFSFMSRGENAAKGAKEFLDQNCQPPPSWTGVYEGK